MRKMIWCLCLALLLGMLAGCQTESSDPTQATAGTRNTDTAPLPTQTGPLSTEPTEEPTRHLIDYDPDRQIFFNSEAIFLDCYVGVGVPYFTMPIYSKTYIDPADISVSFPVDAPIGVEVTQVMGIEGKTEFTATEDDLPENVMPYYVYAAYRGEDVQALAAARMAGEIDWSASEPLRAEFEALTAADLPEFYVYHIRVDLSQVPAPEKNTAWTLEKMEITINGETYEAKLGRVRLYNVEDFEYRGNTVESPENCCVYTENLSELYGDGIVKLPRVCVIDRVKMNYGVLTAVWMLEEDSRILSVRVVIRDVNGKYRTAGVSASDPEIFYGGESVFVDVIVKNEHAEKLLNSIQYQLVVETYESYYNEEWYDEPNDTACKVFTFISSMNTAHYENYAVIFDGVNMEPYYNYYFENYESWREFF